MVYTIPYLTIPYNIVLSIVSSTIVQDAFDRVQHFFHTISACERVVLRLMPGIANTKGMFAAPLTSTEVELGVLVRGGKLTARVE